MQLHSLLVMERGWKPNVDISPNCPRCGSSNTKFCYYNNYSLTQPRYFCKGCRRYWTKGGSLRNVPVGGGCRKNRRGKSLRLSTDILSNRNIPPRGVPSGIGLSRGSFSGDSSGGPSESAGGGSHIDLALVYANFLNNPQPDSKVSKVPNNEPPEEVRNSAVEDQSLPAPGIRSGTDSGVQLIEAGNNAGFFGWESLSDLFLDNHLKISESTFESPGSSIKDVNNGQVFDHGMAGLLHVHHGLGIQQCSSSNNTGYFELPPLPSEGIGSRETMTSTWSDPHHLLADHSLPATELLPVLGPAQAQDPNLLVGGNFKEFDFADDDPLSRK